MATSAINSITPGLTQNQGINGLDVQSLLKIVLTQLTYQDPLKPVDTAQFVSQLAQFTTLEQTRQLTDKVDNLLLVQASNQAVGLLGKSVDLDSQSGKINGIVKAITFANGQPQLTIDANGQITTNVSLSQISQIR